MEFDDDNILFKEDFKVLEDNCSSSESNENVNQIHCEGCSSKTDLILDLYSPLNSIRKEDTFQLVLVKSVQNSQSNTENLEVDMEFEDYDVIMDGKVYQIDDKLIADLPVIAVYVSFGGLLMRLQSDVTKMTLFHIDQEVFLCLKKCSIDSKSIDA